MIYSILAVSGLTGVVTQEAFELSFKEKKQGGVGCFIYLFIIRTLLKWKGSGLGSFTAT